MKFFLRIKHWQLFLLLLVPPLLFQVMMMSAITSGSHPGAVMPFFLPVLLLNVVILFGWFYTLGTELHKKLPASVHMNLARFKIFLFTPLAYIILISLLISITISSSATDPRLFFAWAAIIIPLHLFSIFCLFHNFYFIGKALKSVELRRNVTFEDYAGEFFLLWFFFIGVWFIQPRINKLFDPMEQTSDHLIDDI